MGVDLKDLAPAKRITLEDLTGRVVAIDGYNALHQFLAIIRGEGGQPLMDRGGRVTSHLSGLFYRNTNLLALGIKPLYILDGEPPTLKAREIARRRRVKVEAYERYATALERGELAEARKYAQATGYVTDYMVEDTKRMLDLLGIPWLEAPSEGEATAAHLTRTGAAHAAASQDFDSLLFGATTLVRNITISGRRKLPGRPVYVEVVPEEIRLTEMLQSLGLTREQLVDIGILVGTDFNPDGVKGVGPAKAMKLIREYQRLEAIPGIDQLLAGVDYTAIRDLFLHPRVGDAGPLNWREPNTEGILRFLCGEHAFSEERIRAQLERLKVATSKPEQSLERWFSSPTTA